MGMYENCRCTSVRSFKTAQTNDFSVWQLLSSPDNPADIRSICRRIQFNFLVCLVVWVHIFQATKRSLWLHLHCNCKFCQSRRVVFYGQLLTVTTKN